MKCIYIRPAGVVLEKILVNRDTFPHLKRFDSSVLRTIQVKGQKKEDSSGFELRMSFLVVM